MNKIITKSLCVFVAITVSALVGASVAAAAGKPPPPGYHAAKKTLPKKHQTSRSRPQVSGAMRKSVRNDKKPGKQKLLTHDPYKARKNDFVFGPTNRGSLKRLKDKTGAKTVNDFGHLRKDQNWKQFSKKMIDIIHASNGRIHFDLTHVKDLRGILKNKGPHKDKVTSHELRYLKQNWAKFKNNVSFYRNGQRVSAPW